MVCAWSDASTQPPDADLPEQVRELREEIRSEMIRQESFPIDEYKSAPVLPEDSQLRDACFGKAPQQNKQVIPKSNGDLPQQSTLSEDINAVIGSVADGCGSYKATQRFSVLDLNKWYLTSMLSVDDNQANSVLGDLQGGRYYRGALYRGDSGYNPDRGEGGNELLNRARFTRPDRTMLNGCAQQLMVYPIIGNVDITNPIWMRRELDNCLNQYILQHGRFPRINENFNATYFGINAGLCQPLKLQVPPSRFDKYEYAPSEYLGVAWRKLLVDAYYTLRDGKAKAEPNYNRHSKMHVRTQIPMPENNFGQILIEDLAESKATGGQVDLLYEKILDPSHPFSPRWDYEKTDRSLSQGPWQVLCGTVPIDIMKFREGPFESTIMKNINSNRMMMILCTPAKGNPKHPAYSFCQMNNWCSTPPAPNNDCCSVNYLFDDKINSQFRKKFCGLPIVDACNFIGRPVTPLNTLKMREVTSANFQGGQAPEGYTFKEYFGTNKPYMRCWDSNTECGERSQLFSITGAPVGGSGILPASPAAFAAAGITNPADIAAIANSGISPTALQGFVNGGGIGNLTALSQAGLSPEMFGNLGNISSLANIPNASQITGLIGQGGISPASLGSLASLPSPLSGANIGSLTSLASGNVPTSMIQQVTSMPSGVVQGLPQMIQAANGNPAALVSQLQSQGVTINGTTASQFISNAGSLTNAIPNLPSGIPGGINPTQISSLRGLAAGGLNPTQIASALPQMPTISSALSGLPTGQIGQLSGILNNPMAAGNLANLSSLGNLNGIVPSQLSSVTSLFGGSIPNMGNLGGLGGISNVTSLSPQSISAISTASPASLSAISSPVSGVTGALGLGGGKQMLFNPTSTKGADYAILGAGREGESCMIGGGKGEGGLANPDPITSWSELKLYYVRGMRMNVKCIANHEKLFKYYTSEDGLLQVIGARDIPIRERDDRGQLSRYHLTAMPFPWLGYLSDPRGDRQFPNLPNPNVSVSNVGSGLDGAMPNDVLVFGESLVRTGNPATDRLPFVGKVMNANNDAVRAATGATSGGSGVDFVKIRAMNYGKYPDVCGNTDMLGDTTVFTMFKSELPKDYQRRFSALGGNKNVPPSYHCLDPYLSACIEPLWAQIPRYQIKASY